MNVKEHGKTRLQEADDTVKYHEQQLQNLRQSGASQAEIDAQIAEVQAAKDFRQRTVQLNHDEEFRSGAGATGAVVGTAIGAALGTALGPVGTMVGGMIGGMIGDSLGQKVAEWKLESDKQSPPDAQTKRDYFSDDNPPTATETSKTSLETAPKASMADFHRQEDVAHEREIKSRQQIERFQKIDDKLGISSPFKNSATLNATQDFYRQQQQFAKPNPKAEAPTDTPTQKFGEWLDNLLFSKAAASELNETQLAQQAAMERGEVVSPSTEMPTSGEVSTGYGEAIGVPEIEMPSFDEILTYISEFAASIPKLYHLRLKVSANSFRQSAVPFRKVWHLRLKAQAKFSAVSAT